MSEMTDEQYLRALGSAVRGARQEGDEDDPRWERLAAGTLSAEEDAALRELAQADPAIAEAHEAFRPLGLDFQAAVMASWRETPRRGALRVLMPWREHRVRQVAPWPLGRRRAAWTGVAALAAAVAWLVLSPATLPPLPSYGIEVRGGEVAARDVAAASGALELVPDSLVHVTVRPATAVDGPVGAVAFALGDGGPRAVAQPTVGATGVVTLEGTAGEVLGLPPGAWELVVLVGRPGVLPTDPAAGQRLLSDPGDVQVFRQRILMGR
ncbi:MAG: hypothetical protein AMXMBFR64_38930 [Myxococcales bacterium]